MKRETIIRLTAATDLDFDAKGAPMQLAWAWTAGVLWSRRDFDSDHKALFAANMQSAWAHVKHVRAASARRRAMDNDPRVVQLRAAYDALQDRPFAQSIAAEQAQIAADIRALVLGGAREDIVVEQSNG